MCMVMDVLDGGWYKLGCSSGILNINYQAADLEIVDAVYSELDNIPEMVVSLTAAVGCKAREMKVALVPVVATVKISVQQKDVLAKAYIIVVIQAVIPQMTIVLIVCNLQTMLNLK